MQYPLFSLETEIKVYGYSGVVEPDCSVGYMHKVVGIRLLPVYGEGDDGKPTTTYEGWEYLLAHDRYEWGWEPESKIVAAGYGIDLNDGRR